MTGKRKLVDSDSDHDPAPIQAARSKGKGRAQDLSDKLPPNGVAAESQAEPAFQSPLPRLEADDAAVDRASASLEESQNTISSNGHDPRLVGAKTQAVLEAFAHARPAVSHGSPGMRRARVRMSEQPVASRSYTEARSPQIQQRSPYVRSPVRPATELIRTRHSMPPQAIDRPPGQSGTTRMSIPLRLGFDFRGVTAGEGQTRYETPSPGRNRSLLRDEIVSSASKRRRALERAAQRGARSSPDKVYVSTAIPAARSTPDPGIRPHRGRSPSPPLSPAQKTERILAGQELIRAVKDQYRARISGLSEKYGVRPTELFRVVNEMPKSRGGAGSQVYWLDVEEGLRRHFGF